MTKLLGLYALQTVLALCVAASASAQPAPLPIAALTRVPQSVPKAAPELTPYRGGKHYTAALLSYATPALGAAPLRLRALVTTPKSAMPAAGFPVLIANHGYHPEPAQYGVRANGEDWRPGDYYAAIPEAFSAAGFMVLMPDYRGHNSSAGHDFTQGPMTSSYYSEDVLALLSVQGQLPGASASNWYMWGHSLGGEVTLRALLATQVIKAASLWSTMGGDLWQQALFYHAERAGSLSGKAAQETIATLRARVEQRIAPNRWQDYEPLAHLSRLQTPLLIHHARRDTGTAYDWSLQLAAALAYHNKAFTLHSYEGSDHLFAGPQFEQAVARDVAFFKSAAPSARN